MKEENAYGEPMLVCPECGSNEVTVTIWRTGRVGLLRLSLVVIAI